jgi:UDP-3-O-[3-hydroxymyristoyl] glucosamine N-acyltransferase
MKFSEIVEKLGDVVIDSSLVSGHDPEVAGLAAIDEATSGTISYVEGDKFASFVGKTDASALILPRKSDLHMQAQSRGIAWIAVRDPRMVFAQTIALFYQPFRPTPEIHPTAVIHPTAKVGNDVHLGAHVVIQAGAELGDDVIVHPNVVIYPGVKIGDRTVLHANCTIHERTQIGEDCVIHSGAVIGAEGFGFVPTATGWFKMQQSGCTILEDGVEVGCNSAIDRPAVGETRVGRYTIIDNMVQIGHGCHIGSGCALAGQSGLAGGVIIGNRVTMAGQSGVANQVRIGDGAIATAKAGIHGDIAPGEIVSGNPAIPHKLFLRISVIYKRLPEIYKALKELQRKDN